MILRNKDKIRLIEIFKSTNTSFEVWAYGSRVNGDAHDGSDLDLVIRTPDIQKMPSNILLDLKAKIRESNIPIIVELFDWAQLPESFHRNIEAKHEVLFSQTNLILNDPAEGYNKDE